MQERWFKFARACALFRAPAYPAPVANTPKQKNKTKKLIEHSNHALAYLPTKPTPGPALDGLDELDAWGGATTAPSELERLNNTS